MYINKKGEFIIENYQKGKTFSSFLSGIAGKSGIPMWVFYVNRGQGIASFGIENKDNAILEFLPANEDTAFLSPGNFLKCKLADYRKKQLCENRFPSAMAASEVYLEGGSSVTINSLFGHVSTEDKLDKIKNKVVTSSYLDEKERECQLIHQEITDTIFTKSNYPVFDYYCRQTYLDNKY